MQHLSFNNIQRELPEHSQRESGDHSSRYWGESITDSDHWGSGLQHPHHQLQKHQPYKERSGLHTQTHTHTHKESWFSTGTNCENKTVSSPLLLLAAVLSLNICLGRWAKSSQDFHVLWSMMFGSLREAGASGLKPQCVGRLEITNICLRRAALEVEMISVVEVKAKAKHER